MLKPIILYFNAKKLYEEYEPVATEQVPHVHPLLIPLVIEKVTSQLGTNDLLSFRSVCRAWHSEATPLLRRRLHHKKIPPNLMTKFLRVFRQSRDLPVTSLAFHIETSDDLTSLKSISEALGHFITSVRLTISSQEIPSLPKILQNFRSLNQLTLLRIPEKSLPPTFRKYDTLQDDLSLPNLTSITIGSKWPNLAFICNYDNFLAEIISGSGVRSLEFLNWRCSLEEIFKFGQFKNLVTLHLTSTSTKESELVTLTRRKLGLEQLKLTLGPNIRPETLLNFFQSLQNTLQVLDLTSDSSAHFPVNCDLPKLKALRFQGYKSNIILDDFPTQFPQLESLEILDFQLISLMDYRNCSSKVKILVARPAHPQDEITEGNMAALAVAFPNVTKFHGAYMTDLTLRDTIFKYWTGLQVLCLCPANGLTDFGVNGIPTEVLRATGESALRATGESTLRATGESTLRASGESTLRATGESTLRATGESTLKATGESTLRATGESTLRATGESTLRATGESTLRATGESTLVCLCGREGPDLMNNRRTSHIGNLAGLESLAIVDGSLTNGSFYGIFSLKNLRDLSVNERVVKSVCWKCLQSQLPKLRRLHIICKGPKRLNLDQLKSNLPNVRVYVTSEA